MWQLGSDLSILQDIGNFIKETRLQQNKSQELAAEEAGVHRSTLVRMENGEGGTLLSFVQILRMLGKLELLQAFETKQQISPLLLAELELKKRRRARTKRGSTEQQSKSDW
ncbi:MAG: helix-turn-helix transcriptional regulator [Bacteroidota bacterium]